MYAIKLPKGTTPTMANWLSATEYGAVVTLDSGLTIGVGHYDGEEITMPDKPFDVFVCCHPGLLPDSIPHIGEWECATYTQPRGNKTMGYYLCVFAEYELRADGKAPIENVPTTYIQ